MIKYEHVIFVGLQHVILFLNESFEALIFIFLRRVLLEMASLVFISKPKKTPKTKSKNERKAVVSKFLFKLILSIYSSCTCAVSYMCLEV